MKKIASILAALICIAFAGSLYGIPVQLTFGDGRSIGLVNDGIPSNPGDVAGYVNTLMTVPLGTGPVAIGSETYTRTSNSFGALPPASGEVGDFYKQDNSNNIFDLGLNGFTYLVGKYDAHNAGAYVWYIGGLWGQVQIPQQFSDNQYGLSYSIAFVPGRNERVPDSGSALVLFGIAMLGLLCVRRLAPV